MLENCLRREFQKFSVLKERISNFFAKFRMARYKKCTRGPDQTSGLIIPFGTFATCPHIEERREFQNVRSPKKNYDVVVGRVATAARKCDANELSRIDKSWNAPGIDWGDAGGVVIRAHLRGRVAIPVCSTGMITGERRGASSENRGALVYVAHCQADGRIGGASVYKRIVIDDSAEQ